MSLYFSSGGQEGYLPNRFLDHIVAEKWRCTPEEARQASHGDFFDALEFHSARSNGLDDKAANDQARREADQAAKS